MVLDPDPKIGKVFFNEIRVGIGNVYFISEEFILVGHLQLQPSYTLDMRRLREHVHWLDFLCFVASCF